MFLKLTLILEIIVCQQHVCNCSPETNMPKVNLRNSKKVIPIYAS
jgi:hypothetical protein